MQANCLNCSSPNVQNYCPNCGQKASTHRYSIKHFVEHDFVHGVWHVDKGIFFTLKELFTRPGHSVREYLQGKRANYFSFITLILLIIAISSLIAPYVHIKQTDLSPAQNGIEEKAMMSSFEALIAKYPKLYILITIPIISFFSFIWFRKAKLNFSEHLVANSYKAAVELIFTLSFSVITIFYTNIDVLRILFNFIVMPLTLAYTIWYYYQLFSTYGYSKKALLGRSIAAIISYSMFIIIFGAVATVIQKMTQ